MNSRLSDFCRHGTPRPQHLIQKYQAKKALQAEAEATGQILPVNKSPKKIHKVKSSFDSKFMGSQSPSDSGIRPDEDSLLSRPTKRPHRMVTLDDVGITPYVPLIQHEKSVHAPLKAQEVKESFLDSPVRKMNTVSRHSPKRQRIFTDEFSNQNSFQFPPVLSPLTVGSALF